MIDSAYPPLDGRLVGNILRDCYADGKWKGWPAVSNEKLVFAFIRELGGKIQKAAITAPSRIIRHGGHRIGSK
jgi:hypothetical protein